MLNHELNPRTRQHTDKHSDSSNQTPEFTLDSNTTNTNTNNQYQMMKGELSKLSVTPFISPHRKEKQANFLNFYNDRSPQKYMPINDNDIVFSPHKMQVKPNFIPYSGFKKSNDIFDPNFTKFNKTTTNEFIKDSLFTKTRNKFKEMKSSQKRQTE